MRRLVDASRVRIPVPVRSRPRWFRRIPTRIAHGIGHDHARVFMDSIGNKAVNPKLAESAPNPTHQSTGSRGTRPDVPSTSRLPANVQADEHEGRQRATVEAIDFANFDAAVSTQRWRLPTSRDARCMSSGDRLTDKTERAGASVRQDL